RSGLTCVDQVCCDRACEGSCEACDLSGAIGVCTPVASSPPHGNRTCGVGECVGCCTGRSDGQCKYPTNACGAPAYCAPDGISLVDQSICKAGTCTTPPAVACPGAFACALGACKRSCTTDVDCASTHFCARGVCRETATIAAG